MCKGVGVCVRWSGLVTVEGREGGQGMWSE